MAGVFRDLGLAVLERGWLSSNNILFQESPDAPATIVDTGFGSHAQQTVAVVRAGLGSVPLGRVVNRHLHSDHCGGNAQIPNATLIVQRREWDAGMDPDDATRSGFDSRDFDLGHKLGPCV